jgi:hypothetical protein
VKGQKSNLFLQATDGQPLLEKRRGVFVLNFILYYGLIAFATFYTPRPAEPGNAVNLRKFVDNITK